MGYADIDEVLHAGIFSDAHSVTRGNQINPAEFRRFRRAGMGYTDQLYESICKGDAGRVRIALQGIARDHDTPGR